jgi:hypothetical protein
MREAFKASLPLGKEHFENPIVHRLFAEHYEMLAKGLLNHYLNRDQDDIGKKDEIMTLAETEDMKYYNVWNFARCWCKL